MNQKIQRITVKGIIYKDGSIFMLKDTDGNWELPGGRIDFGEHPKETMQREFIEELGVDNVKVGDIVNVWDFTTKSDGDNYHFILVVFECEANLTDIKISDEHVEHKWIKLDEIHNYPVRDGYFESIDKFRKIKEL